MYPKILVEANQELVLPDGVKLYADIYHPDAPGRFPTLLMRSPYNKLLAQTNGFAHPVWYARHGFVVVVQDVRGRYKSDGNFSPFADEAQDGFVTISWVSTLPFSDGQVATYGFSYCGLNQLMSAALCPPALRTVVPAFTGGDRFEHWHYPGGVFALGFNLTWSLKIAVTEAIRQGDKKKAKIAQDALRNPNLLSSSFSPDQFFIELGLDNLVPFWKEWFTHTDRDLSWQAKSMRSGYASVKVPTLHIGGWYDSFLEGTLETFEELSGRKGGAGIKPIHHLVIGPWYHMPWSRKVGGIDFGEEAAISLDETQLAWFNFILKGVPLSPEYHSPVRIFVMGINRWRNEMTFPLERAKLTHYYLHSKGRANSIGGDGWLDLNSPGSELPDMFVVDPLDPTPSLGGRGCCLSQLCPMGAEDQSPVEQRNDILIYSSSPLDKDVEVTGKVVAVIYVTSSSQDADYFVKLIDVFPDGRAINICDGILRAQFYDGYSHEKEMQSGQVIELKIPMAATSNCFQKGHCIRVEVAGANFPRFDYKFGKNDPGLQMVYHDESKPSYILLPIVTD